MAFLYLDKYPIATVSSLGFYVFLILLVLPAFRRRVEALFVHPSASASRHLGALDGFRGLAAAYVAIGHSWHWTYPVFYKTQHTVPALAYAAKAVPIFAVLSGFLIYRSIRNAATATDFRTFLLRRFFRIYPLYIVAVLFTLLIGQMATDYKDIGFTQLLVAEIFMLRTLDFPIFANPVTWSLYIEIVFYMIIPVFVLVVQPRENRNTLAILLSLLAIFYIADQFSGRELHLWKYFLFGAIAAEIGIKYPEMLDGISGKILLLGGVTLFILDLGGPKFDIFHLAGLTIKNLSEYTIGLGLSTAMIALAAPHVRIASRVMDLFPIKLAGIISYSVFLVHPFYLAANFPDLIWRRVGTQYELFKTMEAMPTWYLPFVFFPGIFLWSMATFLLVERPGLTIGARLVRRIRQGGQPVTDAAPPASAPAKPA